MTIYSEAPEHLPWAYTKPSLLVCWWATLFSTVIILLRVAGRFIRSEMLFSEDKMAFFCLVPMYIRMGLVHVILFYGTNNVDLASISLSDETLRRRAIGSGLVLASRIFYSATLWMLKNTILEFFKRLSGLTWSRSYQTSVGIGRCVLIVTFIAVVISDLAECQPFSHYWQVSPDPGAQCRQGYANLITNGVCNVLTDVLLVALPVPIILRSQMTFKRKAQLVLLFSMSLLVVAVTLYRLPKVISAHGSQQLRSVIASVELLVATSVANALVLGSFVRDRGVKKKRFKYGSIAGESNPTDSGNRSRRPTVAERAWGSDDDLFRDVGFGVQRDLREGLGRMEAEFPQPRPAGQVSPLNSFKNMHKWKFPEGGGEEAGEWRGSLATDHVSDVPSSSGPKKVTFFDVGGLLDDNSSEGPSTMRRQSTMSNRGPTSPAPALAAATNGLRRGSQALIQDLGGLFGPFRIDSGDKGKKIWSKEHTDTAASGMLGVELRDMSPAVSPCTEVPPILPAEPTHQAPGPPPYDDNSTTRRSEDVGGVRQV